MNTPDFATLFFSYREKKTDKQSSIATNTQIPLPTPSSPNIIASTPISSNNPNQYHHNAVHTHHPSTRSPHPISRSTTYRHRPPISKKCKQVKESRTFSRSLIFSSK